MATNAELKIQIDADITNKTGEASITKINVGDNLKDVLDNSTQVYLVKLEQASGGAITPTIVKNTLLDGASFIFEITGTPGLYTVTGSGTTLDYSVSISNLSDTKNVKAFAHMVNGGASSFKQLDLDGNMIPDFNDVYMLIRPLE